MTEGKKYQIFALLEQESSVIHITRMLECHRVTIYRELKLNYKVTQYYSNKAQGSCLIRRKTSAKYCQPLKNIDSISIVIEIDRSPEQISNILKKCGVSVVPHRYYQCIHGDKSNKGILYRHLKQGRKCYLKGK